MNNFRDLKEDEDLVIHVNGRGLHRVDGPAYMRISDGYKSWWIDGKRHREDGPAIELADGRKLWFLNDEELDPIEWLLKVHELQSK